MDLLKNIAFPCLIVAFLLLVPFCAAKENSEGETGDAPLGDDTSDDDSSIDDDDTQSDGTLRFPDGFLFGTATAGFQIEMGCPTLPIEECADVNSDWYRYSVSPETKHDLLTFLSGQDPAVAGPGFWELYDGDLDLAARDLANNAFRMGIEWSRIFPASTVGLETHEELLAVADMDAVEHYRAIFEALRSKGLTPFVTINHYTLPAWIHDGPGCHEDFRNCSPRGWVDKDVTVREIAKYAGFIAKEFGEYVDLWSTENEPLAVILPGYMLQTPERTNPPALLLHMDEFKTVMAAMIEGHARMVDAVRANDDSDADGDGFNAHAGIVYAMSPVVPKDPDSALDAQAAEDTFYLWNLAFLNAVALGEFDENLDGVATNREDLAGRLDFIGLNYYARITVEGLPFSFFPSASPLLTFNPLSLDISEVYPRGIYEMTLYIKEHFGVPVYISENNSRSDPRDDLEKEKRYMVEHLSWLWYAIGRGVDVRGYFYWSLIDNIEWNKGFKDYGLFRVDTEDPLKERSPRETAGQYREISQARGVTPALAARYPVAFD
jgi:beta-galactosidase